MTDRIQGKVAMNLTLGNDRHIKTAHYQIWVVWETPPKDNRREKSERSGKISPLEIRRYGLRPHKSFGKSQSSLFALLIYIYIY